MRKKVLLTGIIVFCFFMFTTTSVNAADEERKLTDKTGDVFDFYGDITETFPEITDIDMNYITYTQDDEQVTVEIEFVDIIEESEELFISLSLITSEQEYEVGYILGETTGADGNGGVIAVYVVVSATHRGEPNAVLCASRVAACDA